jgi:hypothetical protein
MYIQTAVRAEKMDINVARSELTGPPRVNLASLGIELFGVLVLSIGLVTLFS